MDDDLKWMQEQLQASFGQGSALGPLRAVAVVRGEQLQPFRAGGCIRLVKAVERAHVNRPALVPDHDAPAPPVPADVPHAAAAIALRAKAILVALLLCGGADWTTAADELIGAGVTRIERDKVAAVLAELADGTAPSRIARKLRVGYATVARIAETTKRASTEQPHLLQRLLSRPVVEVERTGGRSSS
jgi:hypothetical protein